MKKELKNKIINELENNKYYEIKYNDEITNNDKITINKVQYNIITFTCDDCGDETRYITQLNYDDLRDTLINDDVYYYYDNELVCNDCINYSGNYSRCYYCDELINTNNYDSYITTTNDNIYCRDCLECGRAFYCDDCGEYYDAERYEYYETNDGRTICENCRYNNYVTCDDCGEIFHIDDAIYNDDADAYYCNDCYDRLYFNYNNVNTDVDEITGNINDYTNANAVRGYHDAPRDFIKRCASYENINDCKLFYGVELETSADNYDTQKNASCYIAKNLNCIIENDSSVCGYPMELISDPQTINKWDERREKISKIFNDMINANITSHNNNTCGLHVHVSRDGLGNTSAEQERVINNIILIIENFKQNIIKLTRRDASQLERWAQFISDCNGDDLRDLEKIKKCDKSGRYQALNLRNYNTIEFRIFRGTLNVETFYATLHLVNNIIELAKRDNIRGVSFKQLINLNNYADLIEYSKQRGCDNSTIIINRENKTRYIENKKRREKFRLVVRTNVLKINMFTDLLQYADVINDAVNYMTHGNVARDIEKILNKPNDAKKELIYNNYNNLLSIFKYNIFNFYGAKTYEYLNNDDMKKARNYYNELIALLKAVA